MINSPSLLLPRCCSPSSCAPQALFPLGCFWHSNEEVTVFNDISKENEASKPDRWEARGESLCFLSEGWGSGLKSASDLTL